jgi:hypothetical protein
MHTLKELIDNPSLLEDVKKEAELERRRIEAIEDDYWARIGELVEQHPIAGARGRLG